MRVKKPLSHVHTIFGLSGPTFTSGLIIDSMDGLTLSLAIVFNRSPLLTGAAGAGREIRPLIIENDWLEAIVALRSSFTDLLKRIVFLPVVYCRRPAQTFRYRYEDIAATALTILVARRKAHTVHPSVAFRRAFCAQKRFVFQNEGIR